MDLRHLRYIITGARNGSFSAAAYEFNVRQPIISKRMHHALTERSASSYVLAGENLSDPIIGRLIDRGLDDELKSTAYVVIDGTDGRTHHTKFPTLDAADDGRIGSIVELRRFEDAEGRSRGALAARFDLDLAAQVKATGATWIDRQLVARDPAPLAGDGFGQEVKAAMESRAEHMVEQDLAQRQGKQVIYSRNMLDTLRRRELDSIGKKLAAETGLPFQKAASGEYVAVIYRQRLVRPLCHDRRWAWLPARALDAVA